MSDKKNHLPSRLHLLLLLSLLLSLHDVKSSNCELTDAGTILNCSGLSDFPIGEYYNVTIINFHNNNFNELKASTFNNHKFFKLNTAIIRHCNINYIHPHTFSKMWNIVELQLYGNNLSIFHKNTFTGLEALQHLDLGHNEILLIDAGTLRPLQSLVTLDLSYNSIHALAPHFIKHTNISQLELSGNPIQFPKQGAILESHSLTVLTLQYCNLKEISPNAFTELPKLIFLDLSNNALKILPETLLKPLSYLELLDISFNSIEYLDSEIFLLPTQMVTLLCNGNPLELIRKCEEILDSSKNKNSKHFTRNKLKYLNKVKKLKDFYDESQTKDISAVENESRFWQEHQNNEEETYLISILFVFICLSAFVIIVVPKVYISWQNQRYKVVPTNV